MSLRLGGPARGFVLITSRRESERGEVHGGEEEPSLSPLCCSLTFFRSFSFSLHIPFSVPLFSFFSLFYHSDRREGRRPRTSLKSKSRRSKVEGRGDSRAQDNSKLSHGPTQDPGVRATLFADGRGTRLRIRFLSDRLTVLTFLARASVL